MGSARESDWLVIALVIVVLLAILVPLGFMGFGMMGPWMMGFAWPVMLIIPLLFIALLVLGIYYFVSGGKPGVRPAPQDRALSILRERYARGEISKEEYERMRHDLES